MTDHSPESTTQESAQGGFRRRFARSEAVWDMRTEEEKAMGLMVRRYESGEPIQLEVAAAPAAGVEVNEDRGGERGELSPTLVPLRLNVRDVDVPRHQGEIIAISTKDEQQNSFLKIVRPLSSANGQAVGESIYVEPLSLEETRRVQASGKYRDFRDLLADKTVKMLEGREVLRVMGARPEEIEIFRRGRK